MGEAVSQLQLTLPAIPSLLAALRALPSKRIVVEWVGPVEFLPNFDDLPVQIVDEIAVLRLEYFCSLGLYVFVSYVIVGTLLLVLLNSIDARRSYVPIEPMTSNVVLKFVQCLWLLRCIVPAYIAWVCMLLYVASCRNTIGLTTGVGWEVYILWAMSGLTWGLVEVVLLFGSPGPRPVSLYLKAAVLSHLPVISEKADTLKDLIFSAIAIHAQECRLGMLNLAALLLGHAYLVSSVHTRGEFVETYLPIISAPPTAACEPEDFTEFGSADRSCCSLSSSLRALWEETRMVLLKQTSSARWRIALVEDLPQVGMLVFFATRHGRSTFVVVCMSMSAVRTTLCTPVVQRYVHALLLEPMLSKYHEAVAVGNTPKALSLMEQIWRIPGHEDQEAHELRHLGVTVDEAKFCNLDARRMYLIGISASEMREAGSTASELRQAGYGRRDLRGAGFLATELREAGWEPKDLRYAGYSAKELREAGLQLRQLRQLGVDAAELRGACGADVAMLRTLGYGAAELHFVAGISAKDLKLVGFSASELRLLACGVTQLLAIGCTAVELREAGFRVPDFADAGFNATDVRAAGFKDVRPLWEAGFHATQLRAAKFPAADLAAVGADIQVLQGAGYNAEELRDAGFGAQHLCDVGFSVEEVIAIGFTDASVLRRAGFPLKALREVGYTAKELLSLGEDAGSLFESGFSTHDLQAAGVHRQVGFYGRDPGYLQDLRLAGFCATELYEAGYGVQELQKAGYSATEVRAAGFNDAWVLREAGYSAERLIGACFTPAQLKDAGFSKAMLSALAGPASVGRIGSFDSASMLF